MEMKDEACNCTLIVKHLPPTLKDEDKVSLLQHFGASHVRVMGKSGRMKYTAFASFNNENQAKEGLGRLHQLEVLGYRLSVEYSKKEFQHYHPKIDESTVNEPVVSKTENKKTPVQEAVANDINQFSKFLQYPVNPRLKYRYPAPSMAILTNIANALASVPKFYVQVLHLMNKMNLPAPFGTVTSTPPLPLESSTNFQQGDMEVSSSEESEIEADNDNQIQMPVPRISTKRKLKNPVNIGPKLKLQKITQGMTVNREAGAVTKPEEVFEQTESVFKKSLELKIPSTMVKSKDPEEQPQTLIDHFKQLVLKYEDLEVSSDVLIDALLTIVEQNCDTDSELKQDSIMTAALKLLEKYQINVPESSDMVLKDLKMIVEENEKEGFGVIQPVVKEAEDESEKEDEEIDWSKEGFISSRNLRKGQLSRSKMKEFSVFKNYKAGDPTSRLYVKNIQSKTTEKQLHFIFGKFVDWENETEKNMFDIRLMKEGRMKGQAFITLGNEKSAKEALDSTNGFMLNDKPLVVQFARSAKAKTDEKSLA